MKRLNKNLLIIFFLLAVFVLAIGVWYSPIIFKGYSASIISREIVLARNYYQSGVLANQNNLNVTLASSLIKSEGHSLVLSEYFGSLFYSKIFKITGIPDYNTLILISLILYALVLVLFTILTLRLFNLKVAIMFSLIYIFLPLGWGLTDSFGSYEFCLIFLALFFIFYFMGVKGGEKSKNTIAAFLFIFSGLFLALASLSKEIALVFAFVLFIFLVVKRLKFQLIYIFISFAILLMVFWLPSVLSGENRYLRLFTSKAPEKSVFSVYTHVFPDPYTYYFEKEEFLNKIKNQDLGLIENLQMKKDLVNYGFEGINLFKRVKVGFYILSHHLSRFFSLEEFGGPLITLLLILGFIYLKNKYKFLYKLSFYWIGISLFIFSFVTLVSRNHLMDFIWPIVLGITLGLFYILQIIEERFQIKNKKALILEIVVIGLILYHLLLANHVVLGRKYDRDFMPRSFTYAQEIKKLDIGDSDVIAIPEDFPGQADTLNYLTDKSFVVFKDSTLNKLLNEGKIKQAFEAFGVKYILGYSDDISNKILSQTEVVNIASNSLKIDFGGVSENKSFFMNLVR